MVTSTSSGIRLAYLADHPEFITELAQLHFAEWGALEPEQTVDVRAGDFRAYRGRGGFPTALIALVGHTLVGSLLLVADDLAIRPELTPWLAGVYVKPAFRRRGVATTLIEAGIREAVLQGLPYLYLYTPDHESLYARLGWTRIERCSFHDTEVTIMRREL